ncbi:MAG: hypothetical protein WKG00_34910 [Polyangiaceae bacterium]
MTSKLAGWTEGSLLKRTLLHVSAFVLGSLAFLGIASLVLTSIASSVLPSHDPKEPKEGDKDVAVLASPSTGSRSPDGASTGSRSPDGASGSPTSRPGLNPARAGKKRPPIAPTQEATPPSGDDE